MLPPLIAWLAESGAIVSATMVFYMRSKIKQANRQVERARVAATTNPVELMVQVKNWPAKQAASRS